MYLALGLDLISAHLWFSINTMRTLGLAGAAPPVPVLAAVVVLPEPPAPPEPVAPPLLPAALVVEGLPPEPVLVVVVSLDEQLAAATSRGTRARRGAVAMRMIARIHEIRAAGSYALISRR